MPPIETLEVMPWSYYELLSQGAPTSLSCLFMTDIVTLLEEECLVPPCWQAVWIDGAKPVAYCPVSLTVQLNQRRPPGGHCKPDFLLTLHPNYFTYFFIESIIEIIIYSHGVVRNNTVHFIQLLPVVTSQNYQNQGVDTDTVHWSIFDNAFQ